MAINTRYGWTAGSISHNSALHDAALQSRAPVFSPTAAPSEIGPMNGLGQRPFSAADLLTDPSTSRDPLLASRTFKQPDTGVRDVGAQASTFQTPDAPAFLQQAIANLNAEQTLKRAQQSELVNRILSGVNAGGSDSYLYSEALRAAAVSPGAHVSFGASVLDPKIGAGYQTAADAYADKTNQQTQALTAANTALSSTPDLEKRRAALGSVVMGGYEGSPQQALDRQITQARLNAGPGSSTQLLGRSANTSGWFPSLPTF